MADPTNIPFGLSDITVGEGPTAVKFNGVDFFQGDGGEVTLTPILEEIKLADLGDSVYDERVIGHEGEVKLVAAQEDIKILEAAMSFMDSITETVGGATIGLMDSKIGSSMRAKAKKVTIHPRIKGADKSADITLYKMAGSGEFSRSYANEQGKVEMTFKLYPRDGFDVSKPGNFYYIGPTDPNAAP